jgi:CSLREA domain-containing protein
MRRTSLTVAVALSCLLGAAAPLARPAFVVDSPADTSDTSPGDGLCADANGACTLRAAIEEANALGGPDRVEFALPTPVAPIFPSSPLTITEAIAIDGYSNNPAASPNTLAKGTNAVIEVAIDGTSFTSFPVEAIQVRAPNVELRGLAIRNFAFGVCVHFGYGGIVDPTGSRLVGSRIEHCDTGVYLDLTSAVRVGDSSNDARNLIVDNRVGVYDSASTGPNFILNNLIGTDESGMAQRPNTVGLQLRNASSVADNVISGNGTGVLIQGRDNKLARNLIGTTANGGAALGNSIGVDVQAPSTSANNQIGRPSSSKANANLVSGNGTGLRLRGPGGGNLVQGNFIGTGPLGVGAMQNLVGIEISASDGNVIGAPGNTPATNQGNVIAHNTQAGIVLPIAGGGLPIGINNTIRGNRIFDNPFDIDLGVDFLINDDPGDVDFGPNGLLNPPRTQTATAVQGQTRISGVIDAAAGAYTLDFYSGTSCDTGADTGRAEFYLGSAQLQATPTTSNPLTAFDVILPVTAGGQGFTATATTFGSTSELGSCAVGSSTGVADMEVTLDPVAASLDPGDAIDLRVHLRNGGPLAATNVPVFVPPPPGIGTWSSASASPGVFGSSSNVWTLFFMAPGSNAVLDLTATVPASTAGPMTFSASADQGLAELDPDLANNRASASSFVRSGADLTLTLTPAVRGAPQGGMVDFDITVTNQGPDDARSVQLTGELDPLLVPQNGLTLDANRRWTLALGDLAEGDSRSVRIRALVDTSTPDATGLRQNVWAVAAGGPWDATPNLATAVVGVPAAADLAIKSIARTWNDPDGEWTATVVNLGPDTVSKFCVYGGSNPSSGGPLPRGQAMTVDIDVTLTPFTLTIRSATACSSSHFELNPWDNTATVTNLPACASFGIEAPIFGLWLLVRGRFGRRKQRGHSGGGAALALAALLGAAAPDPAHASPLALAVDSAASSATLALATPLGTPAPVAVTLSGTASADVTLATDALFGFYASSLRLSGGGVALSDASILLESFPLYSLTFASQGLAANLSGPSMSGFAVASGLSLFDLFGGALALDTGTVGATGDYLGLPINESLDLATVPFTAFFPLGSVAEARVVDLGGSQASVELRIPFSAPFQLSVDNTQNTLTIAGTLVLRGVAVPEPADAALLLLGSLALAASRRQQRET